VRKEVKEGEERGRKEGRGREEKEAENYIKIGR
jgi:hypothetical protein